MDNTHLHGPTDASLLTFQGTHRSRDITMQNLDSEMIVRRSDNSLWTVLGGRLDPNYPHPRVLDLLHRIGFYGVYRTGRLKVDDHLITALVERWRQETHTFHFRVGEVTVTLQDVAVIWGLPVEGMAVCGTETHRSKEEWIEYCHEYLGFTPKHNDFEGSRLKQKVIGTYLGMHPITDESTEREVEQYTRCCALLLLGGTMCPDSSERFIPLLYVDKFENIHQVGMYSWGSTVLAYLYSELCCACERRHRNIGGPMSLLQIWAYSRISSLAPELGPRDMTSIDIGDDRILPVSPYGGRWRSGHRFTHTAHHSVRIIRDILDHMLDVQFNWQPYDMNDDDIAPYVDGDNITWRSKCPLIFYHIVEMHHPERVLRQFGMIQTIPPVPEFRDAGLHRVVRTGRSTVDWLQFHAQFIHLWENREQFIQGNQNIDVDGRTKDADYDEWYDRRTRRFISPLSYIVDAGYQVGLAAEREYVINQLTLMSMAGRSIPDHVIRNMPPEGKQIVDQMTQLSNATLTVMRRNDGQQDVPPPQPREDPVRGRDGSTRRRTHSVSSTDSPAHPHPHNHNSKE